MGSSYSVVVGCYLEFPTSPQIEKEFIWLQHPQTQEKYDISTGVKFCPKTGVELETVSELRTVSVELSAYIEDEVLGSDGNMLLEDAFVKPESLKNIFLSNLEGMRIGAYRDFNEVDLSSVNVQQKIQEFSLRYKDYIDYYRKQFGSCEVKFGVVGYWS